MRRRVRFSGCLLGTRLVKRGRLVVEILSALCQRLSRFPSFIWLLVEVIEPGTEGILLFSEFLGDPTVRYSEQGSPSPLEVLTWKRSR